MMDNKINFISSKESLDSVSFAPSEQQEQMFEKF